jgi:glyoxylate reductase
MNFKVIITGRIPGEWLGALDRLADPIIWNGRKHFLMPRKALLEGIAGCDAVLNFAEVMADEELLQKANSLKIIANASIGFDNLNLPLLTAKKIWASNAPGFFSYPVAEYAFAGILAISRRLFEADDFVRSGKWRAFEPGRWDGVSLKEKTIGIVGLGTIGKQLRVMAQAMGARVIYYSPAHREEEDWHSFEELIRISDVISIHVPLNAGSLGLFDRNVISAMKAGVIIVNTSRGAVIDQEALVEALRSGKIGGAVLDVFQDEPAIPRTLFKMKNVLLTPHMAGGTLSAREACIRRAAQNVAAALKGNKPPDALNAF